MKVHEMFQEEKKRQLHRELALEALDNRNEIISKLIIMERLKDATELLFATDGTSLKGRGLSEKIFQHFHEGKDSDLLLRLVDHYYWSTERPGKSLSIEIHPGEWFVIKETFATMIFMAICQ